MRSSGFVGVLSVSIGLSACGGGGGTPPPPVATPPAVYSVAGTVSGLTGTLVLRVNDATDVSVTANGAVTLASSLANGASYTVSVKSQPSGPTQNCELANATGTIAAANVTNVTVTCAVVPLALASSTPANGATSVSRDAPLTLTFSTTIDAAAASVALTGPAGDVATSTQVSGAQLIITPTAKLVKLGAYALTVDGVKGTGGELLAAPVSLGFEAADGTWSAPVALAPAAGDASYPRIAMDAKGNALAVWVQASGGNIGVASNHWSAGAGWDGLRRIDSIDFSPAAMPEVRFDRDGNALALWVQVAGSKNATWYNRFDSSGTWGTAVQISSGKDDTAWPTFDFDADGAALAVWENTVRPTPDAFDFSPSSGWSGAAFPTTTNPARTVHVCIDSTGRAQVVWTVTNGGTTQVRANSHVKGAWLGMAVLDEMDGFIDSLRIVCPATGGAVAAWIGTSAGVRHVHSAGWTEDGWSGAAALSAGTVDASLLALASDATGHTSILWAQSGNGARLLTRRAGADLRWSPALRVDDATAGNPSEPGLALDADGNGWAVWSVAATGKPSRISAARVRHGEFSAPRLLDPDATVSANAARVATDPDGNAIAVWLNCPKACTIVGSRFE